MANNDSRRGYNWIITVIDSNAKAFPPARSLLDVGVPLGIANKWKRVRYEMTTGLKRRLSKTEALN